MKIIENQPLAPFSTFEIGGPARFFVEVVTVTEMQEALQYAEQQKLPYFILGRGSNSLIPDAGFPGLVILNKIAFCEDLTSGKFHVGAGYNFSLLGAQTARKKWAGLEFASGIPGSVGGAVYMNAGANGHETKDALLDVTHVSEAGELKIYKKEEIEFGYRFSSFQKQKGAIVSAHFQLVASHEAKKKQLEIVDYRMRTQPYGIPSCGCVFRNPHGASAGALIDKCGLKGTGVGGAQISPVHANFIVNTGGATAQDVLALSELVKQRVKETTGIDLEMEIRCVSC